MATPKGYRQIGREYTHKADAVKEAKRARRAYGDSYKVCPVKSGKAILYYQIYWKRRR